ncbi:hypothetical protein TEA_010699 [Camellia sinensis var. sinensis]|uniref:non-specific serine/threonine protein kinase n=1 Tax=Camellia sinensis var. sinensis TaxID=542762 RepID=A0A4S4E4C0_CAMSN|nr:hypothetical protein TEA_010699 [Camellia sinensis var. sinensis]
MQLWDKPSGGALADFNTHFSFVIDSQNKTSYANGITFFLALVGSPIPFQEGSGIGLVSREQVFNPAFNSSSNPFVAVEFDTYHNPEYDPLSDHVASRSGNTTRLKEKMIMISMFCMSLKAKQDLRSFHTKNWVSKGSKQGIKEYALEVKIINWLRHRNLVQLLGWYHEEKELLLVYEFMPNGNLDSHLFKGNTFLTWLTRYNIAKGLATALLYLREEWEQCVLHRDIKSSNIMLDSNFNAKLGDFGLARIVDHGKESKTMVLARTMGYMAPECVMTGKASKESDVYSFGIVYLEIACGRKPIDLIAKNGHEILVEWVWELYGRGNLLGATYVKLEDFNEEQIECLIIVRLWCAHPDYNLRPLIKQAIQVLNLEAPLPSLPPKMPVPTYSALERIGIESSSPSYHIISSKHTTTPIVLSS